ncbi:MAG: hypothetical protein LQ350_005144 [Teloschistes chrysophthalmus]|nr:MAG: hypothetical protein LQ350_005144 [Niorma chrysophthalma]
MAILRIVYTVRGNVDSSGQRVNAQINVGIVCACLPTLKPIFPKNTAVTTAVRDIVFSIRSRLRSTRPSQFSKDKATNGGINNASLVNREDRYKKMSGDAIDKAFLTEVTNGKELFGPNGDYPMDHIRVRDEVEVV